MDMQHGEAVFFGTLFEALRAALARPPQVVGWVADKGFVVCSPGCSEPGMRYDLVVLTPQVWTPLSLLGEQVMEEVRRARRPPWRGPGRRRRQTPRPDLPLYS